EVSIVCYGRGAEGTEPELEGIEIARAARFVSPRSLRSGPQLAKPAADLALALALLGAHWGRRSDAVLAHNAEAAALALALRARLRSAVVSVVHTLRGRELESSAPAAFAAPLRAVGGRLDGALARRAAALIVLSRAAERGLAAAARGPVARIPPGLPARQAPEPACVAAACRSHGPRPGRFALHAGNLDGYQGLGVLAAAAARLELPVVVATHGAGAAPAPLRTIRVADAAAARRLTFGAAVALLPRRAPGGFPVKLLNYMEAERAIAARASLADTLEHRRSAWLLDDLAAPESWAAAIRALARDPSPPAPLR